MGQTGFCENLRFSAVFCENLRFPAVFCENLPLRNAVIPRKSENQQKSAKISKKTANSAPFVPFSLSLLIPLDLYKEKQTQQQHEQQDPEIETTSYKRKTKKKENDTPPSGASTVCHPLPLESRTIADPIDWPLPIYAGRYVGFFASVLGFVEDALEMFDGALPFCPRGRPSSCGACHRGSLSLSMACAGSRVVHLQRRQCGNVPQ